MFRLLTHAARRLLHMTPLAQLWQVVHARNAANGSALRWAVPLPGDDAPAATLRAKFDAELAALRHRAESTPAD